MLWVTAQFVLFAIIAVLVVATPGTPPALALLGGALCVVAGLALGIGAIRHIGPAVSPFPTPPSHAALVTSGSYRLVRHPIYGGVVLAALGVGVLSWSPGAVAVSLALVPFFLAKASHEERLLSARFDDYEAYVEVTPKRLVPWIV